MSQLDTDLPVVLARVRLASGQCIHGNCGELIDEDLVVRGLRQDERVVHLGQLAEEARVERERTQAVPIASENDLPVTGRLYAPKHNADFPVLLGQQRCRFERDAQPPCGEVIGCDRLCAQRLRGWLVDGGNDLALHPIV